jgi:hypothetical protein
MKKIITLSLIAGLVFTPVKRVKAPEPNSLLWVACSVTVLVVGSFCIWQLYKACKRMNNAQDAPPPPPATNNVTQVQWTNGPVAAMGVLDDSAAVYSDCSLNGYADPMTGSPITTFMQAKLESSADLVRWQEVHTVNGWISSDGLLLLYTSNRVGILTNYVPMNGTNFINLGGATDAAKFYRVTAP